MSSESYSWLAKHVLAGFAETRRPWWASGAEREGNQLNLFPGPVPMTRVEKLLTSWSPEEGDLWDVDLKRATQTLYTADMKPVQAVLLADMGLVESHKLIKASDTHEHLAVVGIDYAVHAYRNWLTGTVSEMVGDEAQVSSAGLLRNRAQAWVQIERPETAVGPDGIKFSPYIMVSTSLDTSLPSQINQNTVMTICDNTMRIGREQGLASRIKHTKESAGKLGVHRGVMAALMAGETDFREELERQLAVKVDDSAFSRFLTSFIPIEEDDTPSKKTRSERKRQEITQLYKSDDRVTSVKGTEFGVVQAVNTWQTHMSQLKNSTGVEMDDTNLRAMRNYAQNLRPVKGDSADQLTAKMLESVLV